MNFEKQIFRTKKSILSGLLRQLNEDEVQRFLPGVNNNIYWLVGHMAASRGSMLKVLGQTVNNTPDLSAFARGSKARELSDNPPFDRLMESFHSRGESIAEALEQIDWQTLRQPAKYIIADKQVTIGDNLRFLLFHEEYHFGQIALLVRMMGKTGIGV